jgi:hypothetical protein
MVSDTRPSARLPGPSHRQPGPPSRRRVSGPAVRWLAIGSSRWWLLPAAALLALLIVGGYGFGWRWTGLSDAVTLWDWMEVLALPVALAGVPLLLRHRQQLSRHHHAGLLLILLGFGALVLAGYLVPLSWTGFSDNTLWDWLELLLLPLVVATASLWAEPVAADEPAATDPRRRRRYLAVAVLGGLAFGLLVLFGYLVPWSWTGFSDNTAWDWVKLLLLPILVPLVLLPIVTEALADRLAPEQPNEPSDAEPAEQPSSAASAVPSASSGSSPDVIDDQGP